MNEPAPTPMVSAVPPPVNSMTPAQVEQEIKYSQTDPTSAYRNGDHPLHDLAVARFKDLLDRRRPAPAAPAADPSDQVPAKPDGYKVDVTLFGGDRWPEADRGAFYQVAHGQRLTQRQAEMLMKFRASHAPTIEQDGITEGLIRAYNALARALGLSERQAIAIAEWFENGPAQAPGHARR